MSNASKGQGGPRESLGAFAPRTMSAETEARDRRAAMASERPLALLAVRAYAELDAERAAHARTLAELRLAAERLARHSAYRGECPCGCRSRVRP